MSGVWIGKPAGGPVRGASGQSGSRYLQTERFRRRQDVPERVRCKDSASEHLTPPLFFPAADGVPPEERPGRISIENFHSTVGASPRDALPSVRAHEGGCGDEGDMEIRILAVACRFLAYPPISLIPISPFMGLRQRRGHLGEHTEPPEPSPNLHGLPGKPPACRRKKGPACLATMPGPSLSVR